MNRDNWNLKQQNREIKNTHTNNENDIKEESKTEKNWLRKDVIERERETERDKGSHKRKKRRQKRNRKRKREVESELKNRERKSDKEKGDR